MRESRKKNSSTDDMPSGLELGQLEKLLDFMASHGLEEFEYEHAGLRIRLKKAAAFPNSAQRAAAPAQVLQAQTAVPQPATHSENTAPPSSTAVTEELHTIKSPIVGTFYAAASPGAPPFVKIGETIQTGQVVCIIEAMKLMNEIEADVSGELVRALVENGQPVEYGQGLFAIRPSKKN